MKSVKSGMPQGIVEKPVRRTKEDLAQGYRVVDCFVASTHVGQRVYNREGILILETPMKAGLKHGREISWDEEGNLLSVEPYANGKIHGTAQQYGHSGKVIATYTMKQGTGFHIWRQEDERNVIFVSEIHSLKDGLPNGYEWWFASSKQDLMHERHWEMGKLHGIERRWNSKGKLHRGYPKFFIADVAVSKQKYAKMTSIDTTLPVYQEKDNLPYRKLPSEIKNLVTS